jgi:hypothetical protein
MMIPIVAARPMRGDATDDQHGQRSAGPQPNRLAGHVGEPAEALLGDEQQSETDHHRDHSGEGERGEDSRAPAQLAHYRRLNGAREAGGHRERDGQSGHAAGAPSGIVTDSSLWNRPKGLPSVSLQRVNQPTPGIGCLSSASPPALRTFAMSASMSSPP